MQFKLIKSFLLYTRVGIHCVIWISSANLLPLYTLIPEKELNVIMCACTGESHFLLEIMVFDCADMPCKERRWNQKQKVLCDYAKGSGSLTSWMKNTGNR